MEAGFLSSFTGAHDTCAHRARCSIPAAEPGYLERPERRGELHRGHDLLDVAGLWFSRTVHELAWSVHNLLGIVRDLARDQARV